jgi:hypothetical protein
MNGVLRSAVLLSASLFCAAVWSATVIYPEPRPTLAKSAAPSWLAGGAGDDGYVSVSARIQMPGPCTVLGSPGVLGIATEKINIVISLRSTGFGSAFEGMDIPIATFDARDDSSACWGLNKLSATVIPFAKLQRFSDVAPGRLGLLVKVRSTSDVAVNAVPTAQALIDVAAIFATGPAAATVATANSALAKPVLTSLENSLNKSLSRAVNGESVYAANWAEVREGISSLTVPVYSGRTKWGENSQEAIERLQAPGTANERVKLFDVVLDFAYTKSIFDPSVAGKSDLPHGPSVLSARVLNQPAFTPNFLQLLNGSSPSLQQVVASANTAANPATTAVWKSTCGKINQTLEAAGLNRLDRLIVTKSFIDEAKGGDAWYRAENLNACFLPEDINSYIRNVYGYPGAVVRYDGAQDGIDAEYAYWAREVLPLATDLGSALQVAKGKGQVIVGLNGRKDLAEVRYVDWAAPGDVPDASDASATAFFAQYPNAWALGSRRIVKAGCYAWFDQTNMSAATAGVHMVVADESGQRWRLYLQLDPKSSSPYRKVQIVRLDDGWKGSFASWVPSESCRRVLED